jgi:pyruvate dehydrogenase E1 component alpha subunit
MGDGSTNIGTFHATLNWAKLWNLPIIFMVENNNYAMGTPYGDHSAVPMIQKAAGYDMYAEDVNGMDVMAVREAVCRVAERARKGDGPSFLNVVTYRYRGHSMADNDQGRNKSEIVEWRQRDPITRFASDVLLKHEHVTAKELEDIQKWAEQQVDGAVEFAEKSPEPPLDSLYRDIYAQDVSNMQTAGTLIRPAQTAGVLSANGKH